MKWGSVFIGGACAVLASVVMTYALFFREPEFWQAFLPDSSVTVFGKTYEGQRFSLREMQKEQALFPLTRIFALEPTYTRFEVPLTLTAQNTQEETELYILKEDQGYWEHVPEEDVGRWNIQQGGVYALGSGVTADLPVFTDVYVQMRADLPKETVRYVIRSVITPEGGVPLLFQEEEGGVCTSNQGGDGKVTFTKMSRTAEIPVNDVMTRTEISFFMESETSLGGCKEPLEIRTKK